MSTTPARNAATRLDWTRLLALHLKKDTSASLTAFRKRYDDAKRTLTSLQEQKSTVDFEHYKAILSNQSIVKDAEKVWKEFTPVKMDVSGQMKAIETVEKKAVANAMEAERRMNEELKGLRETLENIQKARPVEQVSMEDIMVAKPELVEVVEKRIQEGKWTVPGYYEKFGKNSAF